MSEYVELHCHSAFSLLDGASHPEALVERAAALGYRSLALTDHDDLGGAVSFAQAARAAEIEALIGAELTVLVPGRAHRTHLVLLAESGEGYANLCTLITRARMDAPRGRPAVPLELLARHAGGLFALTGCPRGWVPSLVAAGREAAARSAAATLLEIFSGRIALECWDHGLPEERAIVRRLIPLTRSLGVPWVVTNDVHYAAPAGRVTHDVLCALRHARPLDAMGTRLRPNGEWYLRSAARMHRRWRTAPEGLRATLAIAERCAFRLEQLRPTLPAFPLPAGVSDNEYLAQLVEDGACERWGSARTAAHRRQLAHELALIARLGLAGYFLIVWDIVRFARREGILCQGRGSAANSAVCFCLGVTAVDPIALGLLFERFLSEDRAEAPDIDIDFAHQERERVLQYVYERYGREHAAMVCEQITWRGRSAVRDAARVLGFSTEQAGALAVLSDRLSARAAAEAMGVEDAGLLARAGLDPTDRRVRALPALVDGLHQLPRHRSIHVGGFVLTREPLSAVVPIEPAAMPGRSVIQWDKDDVDAAGLVKIDLLGLGMLTLLQRCLLSIRQTRGISLDLAALDVTDQGVYDDLCRADTIGVFQVESRAQMSTLPRLAPRCFYDLVVQVALIRPGPIQGEMVHPYLRRRNGEEPVTYPHPSLEPILRRTLGVPLFQEQGMQVAITAAGFTPGEADQLRRAMGHKRSRSRMAGIGQRLIAGMERNGIAADAARRIYAQITAFADYGFPESHAASFALLVFASAYLRHHYAPEFTAALLNAQPMGFYAPGTIVEDARRHGVVVRPPDVTRSAYDTTLESAAAPDDEACAAGAGDVTRASGSHGAAACAAPAVRLGLRLVRGLGTRARERLERAMAVGGAFRSIGDLVTRAGLDRRALRHLAEAGTLDSLVPEEPVARRRRAAVWRLLEAERGDAGPLAPRPAAPDIPPAVAAQHPAEMTEADYRLTGISLGGHPLRHLRSLLAPNGVRTAREVLELRDGARDVAVAGLVICRQRPTTAKGFVFLTLEDETGLVNVVVTPKRFARDALLISTARLLLVRGTLQVEGGAAGGRPHGAVVHLRGEIFRALSPGVGEEWARGHDFH